MRPTLRFLEPPLLERIVSEARDILCRLGVAVPNPQALSLLADHGAAVDRERFQVRFTEILIDRALQSVPRSFRLYDALGNVSTDFSGDNVHFTPGSAALYLLDGESGEVRRPRTADYIAYAKLVSRLPHIASQSTALVTDDVAVGISDSYRLYLSLRTCEKPVVTGTFTIDSFRVMAEMQRIVRGSAAALREKPLAVFSCCPTSPLKWSDVTSQNVIDCGRAFIPVEFISMPLHGFIAPVTIVGALVQHTAETLSGVVLSQLAQPGAPVLYGGSPAVFDIRTETTPMGDIGTQMTDCAYSEIGKFLGMPTQAYIGLSDSKRLDAQAGLETASGAMLAALAGINNISGPGMLDFESCQSLEKLVLDDEICGMALRLVQGIQPRDDFPSLPLFEELLREKHLLIAAHTRKHRKNEHYVPSAVIDRCNRARHAEEGSPTLDERARKRVAELLQAWTPPRLAPETVRGLDEVMAAEARRCGMEKLPELPR